jgi:tetratricopeptide (TPR) repeat protein
MFTNQDVENYRSRLNKHLEENPENIDALIQLGILEFECFHNHKKAVNFLEKAIELKPLDVNARFWLATCFYHDFCEFDKAKKLLVEVLKLDSNHPESLSLMAWIISNTYGPLNEAINYVQKALIYAPDWPMLRHQLAGLYVSIGKIKEAEQEVKRALEIPPLDPEKISNEVQRYYESVVTGRSWTNEEKKSSHVLERIQRAKLQGSNDHTSCC